MGCFGPIAAPLIYRVKLPSHCTVYCTVPLLRCKLLNLFDIPAATNSYKAQVARSNTKYRRSQSCWEGQKLLLWSGTKN